MIIEICPYNTIKHDIVLQIQWKILYYFVVSLFDLILKKKNGISVTVL